MKVFWPKLGTLWLPGTVEAKRAGCTCDPTPAKLPRVHVRERPAHTNVPDRVDYYEFSSECPYHGDMVMFAFGKDHLTTV